MGNPYFEWIQGDEFGPRNVHVADELRNSESEFLVMVVD